MLTPNCEHRDLFSFSLLRGSIGQLKWIINWNWKLVFQTFQKHLNEFRFVAKLGWVSQVTITIKNILVTRFYSPRQLKANKLAGLGSSSYQVIFIFMYSPGYWTIYSSFSLAIVIYKKLFHRPKTMVFKFNSN